MAATLADECKGYRIPGNVLSPDYFQIAPNGDVMIKDSNISQLIADRINNPSPDAAAITVGVSISISA